MLLRRLRAGSRKNATYTAFREVGRVIRNVQLRRYLSAAPLRRRVTAGDLPQRPGHRRDRAPAPGGGPAARRRPGADRCGQTA
ncbi:Tn3 family transposase [Streptomyces sp. NBC_00885]|uniref:Tn3 family transposase n=1 Tax=Streptomyces sp. NBC_00885 TaxID=2975857 RepID=UPI00386E0C4C